MFGGKKSHATKESNFVDNLLQKAHDIYASPSQTQPSFTHKKDAYGKVIDDCNGDPVCTLRKDSNRFD